MRVLVFPGGTENGLEVHKSLCRSRDVRLYSAGDERPSHAPFAYQCHLTLPRVRRPGWISALNRAIVAHRIDYVYPAHDDVLTALVQHRERIQAPVVASPTKTCLMTRSKGRTYALLESCVPVPDRYDDPDDVPRYPVFVKPDRGQGSQDTHVVNDRAHLDWVLAQAEAFGGGRLILEYLPGEEFTVDCFSDRERGLLFCGARRRVRTRSGIAMQSDPAPAGPFREYAERISSRLEFHGAWFFQVKRDEAGAYKLLEVAPRIAGTSALHRALGVNLPLLSLYEQARRPIEIVTNECAIVIDRALVNRYRHGLCYRTVYVDLDDTLVLRGKVNTQLVAFLYQCINRGVRIVLLTKHRGDLTATLQEHRLATLFDEVLHLPAAAAKADAIDPDGAIFIDDSFAERKAVRERFAIPVFDCSMIEALLDERF